MKVGRKRVARLLRTAGLVGCHRRRRWRPGLTRRDPRAAPAPDLVKRHFIATKPDRVWHADLTELPTDQGALYLAAIVDGCSRLAVGYAMVSTRRPSWRSVRWSLGCGAAAWSATG